MSNEAVARVFKRLADRLQEVVTDTSMMTITPEFSAHFLEVYIKKRFFSVPLRTFACVSLAPWSLTESESFTSPPLSLLSTLAGLRIFLVGCHSFPASLMATPPPLFHTSTLHNRVGTSNSAVLTDLPVVREQPCI